MHYVIKMTAKAGYAEWYTGINVARVPLDDGPEHATHFADKTQAEARAAFVLQNRYLFGASYFEGMTVEVLTLLEAFRQYRARLWAIFQANGGLGVALAEEIDAVDNKLERLAVEGNESANSTTVDQSCVILLEEEPPQVIGPFTTQAAASEYAMDRYMETDICWQIVPLSAPN